MSAEGKMEMVFKVLDYRSISKMVRLMDQLSLFRWLLMLESPMICIYL